jgi:hypothetical protein
MAYRTAGPGSYLYSADGVKVAVYSDQACTVLADIQALDGSALPGSVVTVGATSLLPRFLGPANGAVTLWVQGSGGAVSLAAEVETRVEDTEAVLSAHLVAPDAHGDRAWAQTQFDVTGAAAAAQSAAATDATGKVSTHASATDPHGDRAWASGQFDAAGAAGTALSAAAADATSKVSTHAGAADPHGDRAWASGQFDASGAAASAQTAAAADATSKVSGHAAASDPHGDRADAATKYTPLTDPRLTNSRTPTSHASSHASAGSDPVTPASIGALAASGDQVMHGELTFGDRIPVGPGITPAFDNQLTHLGFTNATYTGRTANLSDLQSPATARDNLGLGNSATRAVGTTAGTVAAGDDSRLSNSRAPTAHAASHASGGSDAVTPASIGALSLASYGNIWTPSDHGYIAWTYDPAESSSAGTALSAGFIYMLAVLLRQGATISKLNLYVGTAGSGLTAYQCLAGLYDASGTRVGITADMSTTWNSTGHKAMSLTSSYAAAAGRYYVALLFNGTTSPVIACGSTQGATFTPGNSGLTAGNYRFSRSASGQTALPASVTLSGYTPDANNIWAAAS